MGVSQRPAEQKAFAADMAAKAEDRKQALAIIEAWNARLSARQPDLASPTLHAALISGCHWLHVICPACETVAEIDLRVVRRDPALTIAQVLPSLACRGCQPKPPVPKALRLATTIECIWRADAFLFCIRNHTEGFASWTARVQVCAS